MPQETSSGLLTCFIRFLKQVDVGCSFLCCFTGTFFLELYESRTKRYLFVAFVIAVVLFLTLTPRNYQGAVMPPGNCYAKAAVAADAKNCSTIGKDILKRNGSAVDAAIAALLCLSVINPQSIGIGGGVVFTIYNASTGTVETINARETAPMSASEDMFASGSQKTNPGLLIAVPGELRGYAMAHQRHGRLPWKELFEPSIKLAWEGFRIGKALASAIKEEEEKILNNAALREVFCDINNNTLEENDIIRFTQLAVTYRKIAKKGVDAFYSGSLAQTIVDDIKAAGGIITREDLEGYKPVLKEYALNFTVGEYIFHVPDAPFGGPVLALILKILLAGGSSGYKISSESVSNKESRTLTYHRMIEAFCFANEEKSRLGDPRYEDIVNEQVKTMMSDSYAEEIRSKIKDDIPQACSMQKVNVPEDHGTSHLSIIAEDGSAVAVTSSINDYFGSGVMSGSTGIIFNNQMSDFIIDELKLKPSENNKIKPGKRPLSSMCPTIILDKDSRKVRMLVGSEGGTNITTAVAQVILNYLFFGYNLQKAVDHPRVYVTSNATYVENNRTGFPDFKDVIKGLEHLNHRIFYDTEPTVIQAIGREGDKICAKSDDRKGGYPDGY